MLPRGNGQVSTLFGSVDDFEANESIDQTGELYTFAAYPTPTPIPYSAGDDYIGLSVTLSDGIHYGYAEVNGPELVGVGFQTTANTSILTGAQGTANTGIAVTVPEPATGLLICGLTTAALGKRPRR